jgi:hypothetical protein
LHENENFGCPTGPELRSTKVGHSGGWDHEFEASLGYKERPYLNAKTQTKNTQNSNTFYSVENVESK